MEIIPILVGCIIFALSQPNARAVEFDDIGLLPNILDAAESEIYRLQMWTKCLSMINLHNRTALPVSYTEYLAILRDRADINRCLKMTKTEEQDLVYFLLYNHQVWNRPTYQASVAMEVMASIYLASIYDVDERDQLMVTTMWVEMMWQDQLLRWDPLDFNNVSQVRVPCHLLWTPDIVLVNTVGPGKGHKDVNVILDHTGTAYWLPPARYHSVCSLDVTWFPFDEQKCYLIFGLASYSGTKFQVLKLNKIMLYISELISAAEVNLIPFRNDSFKKEYVESGKFELLSITQKILTYSFPEKETFVVYQLHIRRRTLYYVYSNMLPCIFLSILTATVFLAPPASNQKINLGITTLLSLYVYASMLAERMPEVSDSVPLLGVYISMVTMFTTISLVSTVFILGIYDRNFGAFPPYCLDGFAVGVCRFICMEVPYYENFLTIHGKREKKRRPVRHGSLRIRENSRKKCDCPQCLDEKGEKRLQRIRDEAVEVLNATEKFQDAAEESPLTQAWKRIAMIVDRLLLVVFSILVVTSIFSFLLLAPLFQRLKRGTNWWETPFHNE